MFTMISPNLIIPAGNTPGWSSEKQTVGNAGDFSSLLTALQLHPGNPSNVAVPVLTPVSDNGGDSQFLLEQFTGWLNRNHPGYRHIQLKDPLKIAVLTGSTAPGQFVNINHMLLPTSNSGMLPIPTPGFPADKFSPSRNSFTLPAALVKIQNGTAVEVIPTEITLPFDPFLTEPQSGLQPDLFENRQAMAPAEFRSKKAPVPQASGNPGYAEQQPPVKSVMPGATNFSLAAVAENELPFFPLSFGGTTTVFPAAGAGQKKGMFAHLFPEETNPTNIKTTAKVPFKQGGIVTTSSVVPGRHSAAVSSPGGPVQASVPNGNDPTTLPVSPQEGNKAVKPGQSQATVIPEDLPIIISPEENSSQTAVVRQPGEAAGEATVSMNLLRRFFPKSTMVLTNTPGIPDKSVLPPHRVPASENVFSSSGKQPSLMGKESVTVQQSSSQAGILKAGTANGEAAGNIIEAVFPRAPHMTGGKATFTPLAEDGFLQIGVNPQQGHAGTKNTSARNLPGQFPAESVMMENEPKNLSGKITRVFGAGTAKRDGGIPLQNQPSTTGTTPVSGEPLAGQDFSPTTGKVSHFQTVNDPLAGATGLEIPETKIPFEQWLTILDSVFTDSVKISQSTPTLTARPFVGKPFPQWMNGQSVNPSPVVPEPALVATTPETISEPGQPKIPADDGTARKTVVSPRPSPSLPVNSTNVNQPGVYTVLTVMPPVPAKNVLRSSPQVTAGNMSETSPVIEAKPESEQTTAGNVNRQIRAADTAPVMPGGSKNWTASENDLLHRNGSPEVMPAGQPSAAGVSRGQTPVLRVSTPLTGKFTGELAELIHQTAKQLPDLPAGQYRQILIRLQPQHLGLLRIRLRLEDDGLKGRIETSSDDAAQLIRLNMSRLTERLHSLGIHVQDFDVSSQQQFAAPHNLYKEWQENGRRKNSPAMSEKELLALENEGTAARAKADGLVDMMM